MATPVSACAEASCAGVIRTARDVVADVGEEAAKKSEGLVELSRKRPSNGERDCHRLMAKRYRLSLPVSKSILDVKDPALQLPIIRFREWMTFLLQQNCLHILCGLVKADARRQFAILEAFWERFRCQHPDHPIYARAARGEVTLGKVVPLYLHGDEGRSKRRTAFLILNLHSPLGRGILPGLQKPLHDRRAYIKMLPNFVGHSYCNRFLVSALPKSAYSGKNAYVMDVLLKAVPEELDFMANTGVQHGGEQYHAVCLGVVGDWPWLCKSGNLGRSFMNVQKHRTANGDAGGAGDGGGRQGRECGGICHLCCAGQPPFPFEQIGSRQPTWLGSVFSQCPFLTRSPFEILDHCPGKLAAFWHFDFFHTWHLGVAKHYLSSILAVLSSWENDATVDARFESLSTQYLSFCKQTGRQAHCQRITKELLNWVSTTQFPSGSWHKGDLSTSLMAWIEAKFVSEQWQDETLRIAGEAAQSINECIRMMYSGPAWLSPTDARQIGELGLRFLRRYNKLAVMANRQGKRFWLVMPKAHSLHHIFLSLVQDSQRGFCLNPLCTSVQQDEDFIGRGSRLSRHVSSVQCAQRVVDRYLQSAYSKFMESGYLVAASS